MRPTTTRFYEFGFSYIYHKICRFVKLLVIYAYVLSLRARILSRGYLINGLFFGKDFTPILVHGAGGNPCRTKFNSLFSTFPQRVSSDLFERKVGFVCLQYLLQLIDVSAILF